MISVQKKLQERVPGFHFNLGYSGGHFLGGNEKEDEGDWELIKNADKFWWFSHMWLHQQPHDKKTLESMVEDLKKNLDFAKVGIKNIGCSFWRLYNNYYKRFSLSTSA